jgi:amino acid permease
MPLIVDRQGYDTFRADTVVVPDGISCYIVILFAIVLYTGCKIIKRSKFISLSEVDLNSGHENNYSIDVYF